jgi:hypothetical protein
VVSAAPLLPRSFHDLHQDDLAALDHLLDLVGAHPPARALGNLLQSILGADLLDACQRLGGFHLIARDLLDVALPFVGGGVGGLLGAVRE